MLLFGNLTLSILYLIVAASYIILFLSNRKFLDYLAHILLYVTISLHIIYLIYLAMSGGRIALATIFEAMSALALFSSLLYLFLEHRIKEISLGAFLFPLIFCFQLLSIFGNRTPMLENTIFNLPLMGFHTMATILGYTFFIYFMVLGIMYLYLFRLIKRRKIQFGFNHLPPLEILDKLSMITLVIGFVFLSFGLISGSILAVKIWKVLPFFDPKILLTTILWLIYLLSILSKLFFQWSTKRISYLAIVGFILIVVILALEALTRTTLHRF